MTDFFGPRPPPPVEPPDDRPPEWIGPPENELGVVVPVQVELVRTEAIALALPALVVFSTGFMFTLALRQRTRRPLHDHRAPPFHPFAPQPDGLRFGIQLADGRKATTSRPPRPGETPSPPHLLVRRSGGGGGRSSETEMWMWPLPPPGPVAFVCEWRSEGIELTRHELDAQSILDAAKEVHQLWPDERPEATGSRASLG